MVFMIVVVVGGGGGCCCCYCCSDCIGPPHTSSKSCSRHTHVIIDNTVNVGPATQETAQRKTTDYGCSKDVEVCFLLIVIYLRFHSRTCNLSSLETILRFHQSESRAIQKHSLHCALNIN